MYFNSQYKLGPVVQRKIEQLHVTCMQILVEICSVVI